MDVICVRQFDPKDAQEYGDPYPEIGDEDYVIDVVARWGYNFYELARFTGMLYRADYFATLPKQTADEMAEQEKEAILI